MPLLLLYAWLAAPTVNPPSVAVFQLTPRTGINPQTAAVVTDMVSAELRRSGVFGRTISPSDLLVMIPKAQQNEVVQCMMDPCAVVDNEITGGLGVDYVLYGSLAHLGQTFVINLQLYDLHTSQVRAQTTQQVPGSGEEAFLREVKPSVHKLLSDFAGVADSPLKNGTASHARWPAIAGGALLVAGTLIAVLGVLSAVVGGASTALWPRDPSTHNVLVLGAEPRALAQLRVYAALALLPVGALVLLLGLALSSGGAAALLAWQMGRTP